jgi:phosphosulfolactate phosphohydrolase-like enzyme
MFVEIIVQELIEESTNGFIILTSFKHEEQMLVACLFSVPVIGRVHDYRNSMELARVDPPHFFWGNS